MILSAETQLLLSKHHPLPGQSSPGLSLMLTMQRRGAQVRIVATKELHPAVSAAPATSVSVKLLVSPNLGVCLYDLEVDFLLPWR